MPDYYTKVWLRHKSVVIECLFQAVREAIKSINEFEDLLVGSLLVFQSHGIGMSYKPHMHCVLSGGGLDSTGRYQELRSIPLHRLEAIVEDEFEKRINSQLEIEEEAGTSWKRSKQYRVYAGVHDESGAKIIEYLSRTRNGVVVDIEDELEIDQSGVVLKEHENNEIRITHLDVKTFLERYMNHIPPDRIVMARYYGLYSNRKKADYKRAKKQVKIANNVEPMESFKELCPICKSEVITAFIFKRDELHLIPGLKTANGPPKHGEIIKIA